MSTSERSETVYERPLSANTQPLIIEAANAQSLAASNGVVGPSLRSQGAGTLVGLVLATVLSVAATGYALNDLFVYLPLTAYLRDPSLFPGDPLIQHLLRMPYPLYRAYALIYNQQALFVVFLVMRLLTVVALYVLALQIARDRLAAALGLSLIIFTPGTFGTLGLTQVLVGEPVQYTLATPICVFALCASLAGRRAVGFVLAGAAFDLQPILGAVTLALLSGDLIVNRVVRLRRTTLKQAATYLGLGALASTPGIVMAALGPSTDLGKNPAEYLSMVRFGAYFHVLPSTFSSWEYFTTAIVLCYLFLGLRDRAIERVRPTLLVWVGTIFVFCVIGTVFSEVIPIGLVLKAMPFRSTLFLKVLGLICCAVCLRRCIGRRRWWCWVVAALAILGMLTYEELAIGALAILLLAEILWTLPLRRPATTIRLPMGVVGFGRLASPVERYWSRLLVSIPAVLIVLTIPGRPAVVSMPGVGLATDQETLAAWARTFTARDAVFMTPPDDAFAGFTVLAERSTLGNVKQAGQALFDPSFGRILLSRLSELGCNVPEGPWCANNTYATFDAQRFRSLSVRYGACYVITRTSQEVDLPEVYRNDSFRVYGVCGVPSA
jgi:hypothetical protein